MFWLKFNLIVLTIVVQCNNKNKKMYQFFYLHIDTHNLSNMLYILTLFN